MDVEPSDHVRLPRPIVIWAAVTLLAAACVAGAVQVLLMSRACLDNALQHGVAEGGVDGWYDAEQFSCRYTDTSVSTFEFSTRPLIATFVLVVLAIAVLIVEACRRPGRGRDGR